MTEKESLAREIKKIIRFFQKNLTALWFSPQKTAWEWGVASFFACVGKTEKKY